MQEEEARSAPRLEDILKPGKGDRADKAPAAEETPEESFVQELLKEEKSSAHMDTDPDAYRYPPISLLDESTRVDDSQAALEQKTNAELLVQTLKEFGVSTQVVDVSRGPPSPGMSFSPAPV